MIIKKGRCIRNMEYLEKKEFALDYLDSTDKDNFSILNAIYPFSTENLNYFTKELLQDKKVLLTGSSADQILLAQLYKAKLITRLVRKLNMCYNLSARYEGWKLESSLYGVTLIHI